MLVCLGGGAGSALRCLPRVVSGGRAALAEGSGGYYLVAGGIAGGGVGDVSYQRAGIERISLGISPAGLCGGAGIDKSAIFPPDVAVVRRLAGGCRAAAGDISRAAGAVADAARLVCGAGVSLAGNCQAVVALRVWFGFSRAEASDLTRMAADYEVG